MTRGARHDGRTDFPQGRARPLGEPDWPLMANDVTFSITTTRFDEDYSPVGQLPHHDELRQPGTRRAPSAEPPQCADDDRPPIQRPRALGQPEPGPLHASNSTSSRSSCSSPTGGEDQRIPAARGPRHPRSSTGAPAARTKGSSGTTSRPTCATSTSACCSRPPPRLRDIHRPRRFRRFCTASCSSTSSTPTPTTSDSRRRRYLHQRLDEPGPTVAPRTDHPILGVEYEQDDYSLTDEYFGKMGLQVRYFMPPDSVAPLAFYFRGDLLGDYTNLAADRHDQHDGDVSEDLPTGDLQRELHRRRASTDRASRSRTSRGRRSPTTATSAISSRHQAGQVHARSTS